MDLKTLILPQLNLLWLTPQESELEGTWLDTLLAQALQRNKDLKL